MAIIIIPSKNIYGMDNPKIIDNVIDSVTIDQMVIKNDNQYNVSVHLEKYSERHFEHAFKANTEDLAPWETASTLKTDLGLDAWVHYASASVGIRTWYNIDPIKIWLSRIIENKYISSILTGYNKYGNPNVNYSVVYKHYTGTSKIEVHQYPGSNANNSAVKKIELTYNDTDYKTTQGSLPQLFVERTIEYSDNNANVYLSAKSNASQDDKTTLYSENIIGYEDTYGFQILIEKILCGVEKYTATSSGSMTRVDWGGEPEATQAHLTLLGECEKYVPVELQISFNGDTIGINLADGSFTYGSGNKPFSLNGNELLQDNGKVGNKSLSQHLADNILQQYGNGKETATILCDINDYYSTEGEKIISTKDVNFRKMTFDIYDEVVPFISSEKGSETPMSIDFGGRAKTFVVLGRRTIYDGAAWQELHLQEFGVISPKPLNGTEGIEYIISQDGKYYICSGISTTTSREIEIASKIGFAQETALLVKEIQANAFEGTNIISVYIPETITTINDYAFYRCRALQSIELPNLTNIYEGVFMECESIANINIPDTVTEIYGFAFMSCTNLFSVKIGNSVTFIGEEAFNNCLALDNIIIPKSLKEIEYLAFNTARLRVVYYMGTESDWNAINIASGNEYLINATRYYYSEKRPYFEGNYWHYVDGVPTIWETYVAGMLDYTINDDGTSYSVTGIGDFQDEELVIPSVFNNKVVTKIGANAFYDKDFIIRISIPNTIIDIGGGAFSNCNNLVEIFVEDSNTKYKTENGNLYTKDMSTLVQYCIGKDSSHFDIPSGVFVIGSDAFANCQHIKSVTLSVGVRSIGTTAFKECSQLEQVVIPNSVKIISPRAFQKCSKLRDIYYQGTEQEWNSISLGANWNDGVNATIHYNS